MRSRNYSRATLGQYRRTLTNFHHATGDLADATHLDVLRWLDSLNHAPCTRYAYTSTLASFYHWAIREEHLAYDPTLRVYRPKLPRRLPRPADPNAVALALSAASPRVVAMIALGYKTGLRRAEIPQVRAEDLLLHRNAPELIVHGKGQVERLVPLHDSVLTALRAHGIPKRGWVFPSPTTGRGLSPGHVGRLMTAPFANVEGHVTPHMLRHLFASECYEDSGGDLLLVQNLLGHAQPSSTAIYTAFSRPKAARVVRGLFGPQDPSEAA